MKFKIKIILIDLAYFLLLTLILILTRIKISEFLVNIQGYGTQLNAVNINENLQETQNLLSQINSVATKASIFLFIIVPLIIFILYIIFQGLTLKKDKKYFKKFILINLVPYIILVVSLFLFNTYLFILFIITSYLAFVLYFYDKKKIKIALNKIYKLFSLYLIYALLQILIIGFFYLGYTRIPISTDFVWIFVFAVLFSLIFSFYKIYLVKKLV